MKNKSDLTFIEACKMLDKSKRTVSRYIKKGLIKPEKIKSKRGTLQYKFTRDSLLKFKKLGRTERTEQTRPENDIITLLKEQIKVKDEQIKELLERSRETNIMFNRLQNQLLLTEDKKEDRKGREAKEDKKGQGIYSFFKRLFKGVPESER